MTRVAVLGANGQVGAEVCLLLRNQPDIELVPICRNPRGSSYLRYHGLDCRHGLPADPEQARSLLGDADVVLNFMLAQGLPRDTRALHESVIRNAIAAAPDAGHVYFSTMSVYGFPAFAGLRRKTAYSREKLFCERIMLEEAKQRGARAWIFRLGHVCGELQGMTQKVRAELATGPLALSDGGRGASNTTYTANIVEAVRRVSAGQVEPDTYELVTFPEWPWQRIYAYEAEQTGLDFQPADPASGPRATGGARRILGGLLGFLLGLGRRSPVLMDIGRQILPRLPESLNQRINARYQQGRARNEIAELLAPRVLSVTLPEPWKLNNPVRGLSDPVELRRDALYQIREQQPGFAGEPPSAS